MKSFPFFPRYYVDNLEGFWREEKSKNRLISLLSPYPSLTQKYFHQYHFKQRSPWCRNMIGSLSCWDKLSLLLSKPFRVRGAKETVQNPISVHTEVEMRRRKERGKVFFCGVWGRAGPHTESFKTGGLCTLSPPTGELFTFHTKVSPHAVQSHINTSKYMPELSRLH